MLMRNFTCKKICTPRVTVHLCLYFIFFTTNLQDGVGNCDQNDGPKVTIHSSHGTFDTKEDGSASAYIINGPETNIAAGSGLRGIRWLKGP